MLVTAKEILFDAMQTHNTVVAPNVNNELTVKAALQVASVFRVPMILDVCTWAVNDMVEFGRMAEYHASKSPLPIAIQLDHGESMREVLYAMRSGFTSVMIDNSKLDFFKNITETKKVVDICHEAGISVESELGKVNPPGCTASQDCFTDPEEAVEFVEKTDIDSLAVAIGTAHGPYKGIPQIDFERLKVIREKVKIPLVLHGSSGTGDGNLVKASKLGINKVNIAFDLFKNGRETITKDERLDYFIFDKIQAGYQEKLSYYVNLFKNS